MITSTTVGCVKTLEHEFHFGKLCLDVVEVHEFNLLVIALNVAHLHPS